MKGLLRAIGVGSGQEFGYDIGEPIPVNEAYKYRTNWTLYRGVRKSDQGEVTIFAFDLKPTSNGAVVELCRNCLKKAKTMMLPTVLKFLDGQERDNGIFIVTEPVVPLHTYLTQESEDEDMYSKEFISWGLYSIMKGLEQFHTRGFVHGNVGVHSVYVNRSGDWKLFDLDFVSQPATTDPEPSANLFKWHNDMLPNELKAPEVLKSNWALIQSSPVYAIDAWSLGLLLFEVFNKQITSDMSPAELKNPGSMPAPLFHAYMGLMSGNAKMRINPSRLLEENEYFYDNQYIEIQFQIENLALILKDTAEMEAFFRQLEVLIPTFPKANCKWKILPQISQATQFGSGGTAALTTILKLGEVLTTDEYQELVVPGLTALWRSPDPSVRIKLLQSVHLYIRHFREANLVAIWDDVNSGFVSKIAEIRELSVKALVHFVPQLPERIVNNDVLKQIWALQVDKEGGIRTNTVICLGKLVPMLTPEIRNKMLIPCFTRSLKDPFHHSRIACCSSFAATADYYSDQQLASQILPAVSPLLVDGVKDVRVAAFKCMSTLLGRLQKISEGTADPQPIQTTVTPTTQDAQGGGYLTWAVSSIKNKFYAQDASNPNAPTPSGAPRAPAASTPTEHHHQVPDAGSGEYSEAPEEGYYYDTGAYEGVGGGQQDDAWEDEIEFGDEDDPKPEPTPDEGGAWSDIGSDFDDDREAQPPPPPPVVKAREKPAGGMELKKKPVKKSLGAKKLNVD